MSKYGIDKSIWASVVDRAPKRYLDRVGPDRVVLAAAQCDEVDDQVRIAPFASLAEAERSDIAAECHGDNARVVIRNALAAWVMDQSEASEALLEIMQWDKMLSTWCGCAVADTALKYVPAGESRPRIAIDTARLWVLGRATAEQARAASMASYESAEASARDTNVRPSLRRAAQSSASDASIAAYHVAYDARSVASSVADAFARREGAYDYETSGWWVRRDAVLKDLREVVADAIINYPTGEMVNASRGVAGRNVFVAGALGAALGAGAMHIARKL